MSNLRRPAWSALLVCLVLLGIEEWVHAGLRAGRASKAIAAAQTFLGSLRDEQRARARFDFEDANRSDWRFVPGDRKGLALKELDEPQRRAAHDLLGTLLSAQGYLKVVGIADLENTLREIEHNDGRDAGRYWLAFYGEPGSAAWMVRFEGHHVSLNLSGSGAEFEGVTPFFLGTNPACVRSGPRAGLRILRREEEIARELYLGLPEAQRTRATLAGIVPEDVVLSPGRAGCFEKPEGVPFAELAAGSRELAWSLVDEIVGDLAPEAAGPARARLEAAGPERMYFVWCGGTKEGERHYWRISGPQTAFELDNVQGDANHVHRLWRDQQRDLGGDALLEHYRAEHKR
jgi:Protein of unknown function (DUF3500)